jgi:hypothetical protein
MKHWIGGIQKLYAKEPACMRLMTNDIPLLLCQLEIGYQMFLPCALGKLKELLHLRETQTVLHNKDAQSML